ncbi:MAG TPA: hypothetical protein VMV05_11080 [bacterium]|nr:hypothetical protein [bacterium]
MDMQKINVKVFLEKDGQVPLADLIPVFHRWIQEDKLEGLLVDVTEYSHVHQGPGVVLIAHEANYSLDETDGKKGFLYNQKRVPGKDGKDHLRSAFRRAFQGCALLEKEPETAGKMKFAPSHIQVFINDRLEAPFNSEKLGKLEEALNPFLSWLYDGEKYMLLPEKDPKKRTGFEVKVGKAFQLEELLQQLGAS